MPKVTAAITTYNRAALVAGAVESALAQTYDDFEVLVVDDGSTDGTAEVLAPFEGRIRLIRQENAGRGAARNAALAAATGEYVAFLDSDDLWFPHKLARQTPVLDAQPRVALTHGHVEMIDDAGAVLHRATETQRALFGEAHRHGATYEGYALQCVCLTSTVMVRKDAILGLGGYDTSLPALEDLDLYLRLLLAHDIATVGGDPLARYRVHADQTPGLASTYAQIQVCLKHLALLEPGEQPVDLRLARRNLHLTLASAEHRLAHGAAVRRHARSAFRLDPGVALRPALARQIATSFVPRPTRFLFRRFRRQPKLT